MPESAKKLRLTLRKLGLSEPAITAAWPAWWSDEAEGWPSAQVELRFSLSRKLGLDPRSLLEDDEPRFVWRDEAKFKRLSTESDMERAAIASFGASIARTAVTASQGGHPIAGMTASQLRTSILRSQPFVRLTDLLGLCWGVGIPVIHLRVFPLTAKRMCAMTARIDDRFSILLGKDAMYPAPIAYYLSHELGHIALGHLEDDAAVIDLRDPLATQADADAEERDADRFALELLTGTPEPSVNTETQRFTAEQLAENILTTANEVRIEPGTLALCFGHSTGNWRKANAAMRLIYATSQPVWIKVNQVAQQQLDWTAIPEDSAHFLRAVMGAISDGKSRS